MMRCCCGGWRTSFVRAGGCSPPLAGGSTRRSSRRCVAGCSGRRQHPRRWGTHPRCPRRELRAARDLARQLDLELIEVQPGEADDPGYQRNAGDRCYFCKTHLYQTLHGLAGRLGFDYIANGANTDDLGDHRPGLRAADEAQVISPLIEAGLGKAEVRRLAEHLGLSNADKPAAACLASRLAYGTPVTRERLEQVELAEDAMHALGFRGFRVRHHEGGVARLELPLDQLPRLVAEPMRQRVVEAVKAAGYTYIAIDLEGFRSGSGNAVLTVGVTRGGETTCICVRHSGTGTQRERRRHPIVRSRGGVGRTSACSMCSCTTASCPSHRPMG